MSVQDRIISSLRRVEWYNILSEMLELYDANIIAQSEFRGCLGIEMEYNRCEEELDNVEIDEMLTDRPVAEYLERLRGMEPGSMDEYVERRVAIPDEGFGVSLEYTFSKLVYEAPTQEERETLLRFLLSQPEVQAISNQFLKEIPHRTEETDMDYYCDLDDEAFFDEYILSLANRLGIDNLIDLLESDRGR